MSSVGGECPRRQDEARLVRRPGILWRELDGESILLDPDSGSYFALNEVGGRVWQLAEGRPSLLGVRRALLDEFDVDSETLRSDLERLLDRLEAEGLLDVVPDGGSI